MTCEKNGVIRQTLLLHDIFQVSPKIVENCAELVAQKVPEPSVMFYMLYDMNCHQVAHSGQNPPLTGRHNAVIFQSVPLHCVIDLSYFMTFLSSDFLKDFEKPFLVERKWRQVRFRFVTVVYVRAIELGNSELPSRKH